MIMSQYNSILDKKGVGNSKEVGYKMMVFKKSSQKNSYKATNLPILSTSRVTTWKVKHLGTIPLPTAHGLFELHLGGELVKPYVFEVVSYS